MQQSNHIIQAIDSDAHQEHLSTNSDSKKVQYNLGTHFDRSSSKPMTAAGVRVPSTTHKNKSIQLLEISERSSIEQKRKTSKAAYGEFKNQFESPEIKRPETRQLTDKTHSNNSVAV